MSVIDQFTEEQRRIIVTEIARHRKLGFDEGYAKGRGEGEAISVGAWVNGILKSKTMWVGAAGVAAGLSAQILPVVEEVMRGMNIDPNTAAILSAVFMVLRTVTSKGLAQK